MRKCLTQVLKSHEYNFRKDEKKDIEGTGTAKNIEEVCSLVKYAFFLFNTGKWKHEFTRTKKSSTEVFMESSGLDQVQH